MKRFAVLSLLLTLALALSACQAPKPAPKATAAPAGTQAPAPTEAPAEGAAEPEKKAEYRKITAEEAKARMDSGDPLLVIDVRTPEEYAAGHIKGAVNVPLDTIGEGTKETLSDPGYELLLYCRSGNRSRTAAMAMAALGYTNVYDFGGVNAWPYGLVTDP